MRVRRSVLGLALITLLVASGCAADPPESTQPSPVLAYEVRTGSHPHDVAPADDGGVWFTGQRAGFLGHFNPSMQAVTEVPLGEGSAPHGVIVGPDGAAWVTDGGLNAIVRVDSATREVRSYPLPAGREGANLNTATFDRAGSALVHRPGRRVRTARSADWTHDGVRRPAWPRRVWHCDDTGRRGLLRLVGRQLCGANRHDDRQDDGPGTAHSSPRRSSRLVGQQWPHLGQRVECRASGRFRSGEREVARVAAARSEATGVRRVRR